jgi:hypothetical protein
MSKLRVAVLAVCLCGTLLQACSHAEPTPRNFVLVDQRPAKAAEAGNTLEAATAVCKGETDVKGIRSVFGIFRRFRHETVDEDFIACMKRRGYEPAP